MIEQKLRIIAEKMKSPCTNSGLLHGKMGNVLFLYHYARHVDSRYEEYADKWLDDIIEDIRKVNSNYADGLAGIGTGIEYLAQEGFIDNDTNEDLNDVDRLIGRIVSFSPGSIDMRTGITGYGKYFIARLNNPNNDRNINQDTKFIKEQLSKIVDLLSTYYITYEEIFFIIGFLPDMIKLDINKEKAGIFFNYAIDLLETTIHEDIFFGKYPGLFNPLIVSTLLFRSSVKTGNRYLANRALYFLDRYESGFRPHLTEQHAIRWSFLYHTLWKVCNRNIYKKLSIQWLGKITDNNLNPEHGDMITSGMMLLAMNELISDNWLDWFPLH